MSLAGPLLASTVDHNEIAAVHDWVASLDPAAAADFGAQARHFGAALALALPATGTLFFNRVIGLGVVQQASHSLVRDVVDFYRDLGSRFMVHVSPGPGREQLTEWLSEEGLVPAGEWITLHRRDEPVPEPEPADEPPSPWRLERIGRADATCFAQTLCRGYGMPDEWAPLYEGIVGRARWRHYLALEGDTPIATCSIFFNGQSAWCGNSGTLRRYRRQGLHTALSRIRLRDGIEVGCRLFTGETWRPEKGRVNQSLRNHERDGWREVHTRVNYASVITQPTA